MSETKNGEIDVPFWFYVHSKELQFLKIILIGQWMRYSYTRFGGENNKLEKC
jgi:hypothetical protein